MSLEKRTQAQDDGCIVHEHVGHHLGQRGAAHLDAHEQRVAHWGRDVADAEVVHEDKAEMDGMHPEALADGQEQRGEDQDGRGDVHKRACHQKDGVHDEEDDVLIAGQAEQSGCHGVRDL